MNFLTILGWMCLFFAIPLIFCGCGCFAAAVQEWRSQETLVIVELSPPSSMEQI